MPREYSSDVNYEVPPGQMLEAFKVAIDVAFRNALDRGIRHHLVTIQTKEGAVVKAEILDDALVEMRDEHLTAESYAYIVLATDFHTAAAIHISSYVRDTLRVQVKHEDEGWLLKVSGHLDRALKPYQAAYDRDVRRVRPITFEGTMPLPKPKTVAEPSPAPSGASSERSPRLSAKAWAWLGTLAVTVVGGVLVIWITNVFGWTSP